MPRAAPKKNQKPARSKLATVTFKCDADTFAMLDALKHTLTPPMGVASISHSYVIRYAIALLFSRETPAQLRVEE